MLIFAYILSEDNPIPIQSNLFKSDNVVHTHTDTQYVHIHKEYNKVNNKTQRWSPRGRGLGLEDP